jgi:iron complex outermembrane receptor protein
MKGTIAALFVGVSTLASTAALAQDAPPAARNNNGLQDIIVTAQRKAENVINVPLSIQAITGSALKEHNITKFDQLNFTTPGFVVQSGTGYTEAFIRGVGNAVLVGADPSVTVNVDDVPHVYGSLISDFANVERVEVLKGAQGGLYGRNATGGVVNIITKQPTDKLSFDGTMSYGSYQTWDASAYLNIPIVGDKIDWNIAANRYAHDGYVQNKAPKNPYASGVYAGDLANYDTSTGLSCASPGVGTCVANAGLGGLNPGSPGQQKGPGPLNNQNVWNVDSKLLLRPVDNLKITIGADYTAKNDAGGNGWGLFPDAGYHGPADLPTAFGSPNAPGCSFYVCDAIPGSSSLTGSALDYDNLMREFLGQAAYAANINQIHHIESLFQNLGNQKAYGAYLAYAPTWDYGGSIRAVWTLPGIEFTNISALRWNESRFQGDIGAGPVPMAGFQVHVKRHYFYQEDRAQTTDLGRFHLLGGFTYYSDQIDNRINGQFVGFTLSPTFNTEKTTSWSAYGQGAYDITDALTFTASLRYIHETRNDLFPPDATDPFDPGAEISKSLETKFLPAATLSYKTGNGTIYARWARGFKTGGVNPLVRPSRYDYSLIGGVPTLICSAVHAPDCNENTTFKGETVDTYEIGWRTNLWNHRAQFTTAIFYNAYKDLQTVVGGNAENPDVSETFLNAKSARTYGAEASLTVKVAPPLTVSGNIGYLNAKYTNFSFPSNGVINGADDSGNRMQLAPKWQGGVTVDLDQPINDRLNLIGSVLASYTGSYFFSPDDNPITVQKGFWNVNMRVGIRSTDRHYGIYLDIENLFNQTYFAFGSSYGNPDGTDHAANVFGTPRVIKGTLELHF